MVCIDVKFSQDLTQQKSLKSVNFWQSYLKNKKVDFLGTQCSCSLLWKLMCLCGRRAIQKVYAMGEFPMPGLAELRDKYTYLGSELVNVACLAGMLPPSPQRKYHRVYCVFFDFEIIHIHRTLCQANSQQTMCGGQPNFRGQTRPMLFGAHSLSSPSITLFSFIRF